MDLLGDSGEPLQVFCIHDADAYGTLIYETLVEETKARPKRRVQVVNLGLQPWEAVENRLAVEAIDKGPDRRPVASYVVEREDGACWEEWSQTKRIELNEMTTPQFIAWLNEKMAHAPGWERSSRPQKWSRRWSRPKSSASSARRLPSESCRRRVSTNSSPKQSH